MPDHGDGLAAELAQAIQERDEARQQIAEAEHSLTNVGLVLRLIRDRDEVTAERDRLRNEIAEVRALTPEQIARRFHETYERLAPDFGYRTREASAKPWEDVPTHNRALMVATAAEIRYWLSALVGEAEGEAS